jgi:hypothetical protein
MQNDNQEHECANEAVAELFHLHIKPTDLGRFVEKGEQVHAFFSQFDGYDGLDILFLSEVKIMVLLRWNSYQLFDKNLPTILNACPIKDWLKDAEQVTHQPTILRKFTSTLLH